jgi:hypothetical protein
MGTRLERDGKVLMDNLRGVVYHRMAELTVNVKGIVAHPHSGIGGEIDLHIKQPLS